jgi:hypothetical protein
MDKEVSPAASTKRYRATCSDVTAIDSLLTTRMLLTPRMTSAMPGAQAREFRIEDDGQLSAAF